MGLLGKNIYLLSYGEIVIVFCKENFFFAIHNSQIRYFLGSLCYPKSEKFLRCASNLQISSKYCKTQSQTSPKSCLKNFFVQI
jgi:hypothetical protein